jgi:hypothetical protein
MHFLIHGAVPPDVAAALTKKQHAAHALVELADDDAGTPVPLPENAAADPALLLPFLDKRQWNLFTADANLVRDLYERKILFRGIIVLLLPDPDAPSAGPDAVDRLFERYKRLTPGRLYTVTPSRVKIRQLPGAGGGAFRA